MSKIVAPILYFIAAIGLYFSYIGPAYETLQSAQMLREKLAGALADYESLFARRDELRNAYQSISTTQDSGLKQVVPDEIDPVRLIIDLDSIAKAEGLTVGTFSLPREVIASARNAAASMPGDLGVATMSMQVEGTYVQFKRFLTKLELSRTLFDMTTLTANKLPEEGVVGKQRYDMVLSVYWLK